MNRIPGIRRVFRMPFRGAAVYREIDEELNYHLERRIDELKADGMDPGVARDRALVEFGDLAAIKRACRAIGRGRERRVRLAEVLDTILQDVGFATRQYRRSPGFTLVATLTLALGIGATTIIFSVVNSVLLRPLPFDEPDRLVRIWAVTPTGRQFSTSEPNYLDWREMSPVFEAMGAFTEGTLNLTGAGEPKELRSLFASHTLLPALGITPTLGRGILPEEDRPERDQAVVLLGRRFWERELGADPEIVGRTLTLNDRPFTVIGVTPLPAVLRGNRDVVVPLVADPNGQRGNRFVKVVARLAAGASLEQARDVMGRTAQLLADEYPEANEGWGVRVDPLSEVLVGQDVSRAVLALFGAVGFLLVLACVNVSNLLIARGTARRREIALRAALGANRDRIVRQLLVESAILAVLGAAAGMLLTAWAVPIISVLGPGDIPRLDEVSIDRSVLMFALAVTVVTALISGLSPALQAIGRDLHDPLREGGRALASGSRLRDMLVVAELALAVVLLAGAGLMMQSLLRLKAVDPGFELDRVLSVRVTLPGSYPIEQRADFFETLQERVDALPGVARSGATFVEPLSGDDATGVVAHGDEDPATSNEFVEVQFRFVTPGFFETMQIPALAGRAITAIDRPTTLPPDVISFAISETLAKRVWPNEDPVGKRLHFGRGSEAEFVVVGVVGDIRDKYLDAEPPPMLYGHYAVQPMRSMILLVRTATSGEIIAPSIRDEIRQLAPNIPIPDIRPLEDHRSEAVAAPRFLVRLFGLFAALGLVMAAMGVYGIMTFHVSRRSREIGIRMALGAQSGSILRLVLRQSLMRAGLGLTVGLAGAMAVTRLMGSLLFETAPGDPTTYLGVVSVLVAVVLAATLVPAVRAIGVDKKVVLAAE
jgi:predicted permease